jgi:RND family efflux transporter MFP subunit
MSRRALCGIAGKSWRRELNLMASLKNGGLYVAIVGLALAATVTAGNAADQFQVSERAVPDQKIVAATVASKRMAEARARIGGTLVQLEIDEGDHVSQGEMIATVRDSRLGMETRAYDAQIAVAQAEFDRAKADLARTQDLFDKGVYAQARLDQMKAAADSAASALDAAKAQRAASAELESQGQILAPASGMVAKVLVPKGSVVVAGQSVAQITAGALLLRLELPERQAKGLNVGEEVTLLGDESDESVGTGVIQQIYPLVSTGRVSVDATVAKLDSQFIGERVRVAVTLGQRDAIVIPSDYVIVRSGIDYVKLSRGGDTAINVPIQRGAPISLPDVENGLEILSGLKSGDVLVKP